MGTSVIVAVPSRPARHLSIFALCLPTLLVFLPILKRVIELAIRDDRYQQILLAPFICLFLAFRHRAAIFAKARFSPRAGVPLFTFALLLGIVAAYGYREDARLAVFALILSWMAAFILCYGVESFRAALYPLGCLLLMIPLPASWMDGVAALLQHGSAAVSFKILRLSGVPVFRHGMQFSLPGLDFEVAPECSGIRSSLALMMVAIVFGYLYLRSGWSRLALLVLTIPLAIFKNAVRIVGISTLAAYVDRIFIEGPFHHEYGGLLFSLVGVAIFVLMLAGLQKIERWRPARI